MQIPILVISAVLILTACNEAQFAGDRQNPDAGPSSAAAEHISLDQDARQADDPVAPEASAPVEEPELVSHAIRTETGDAGEEETGNADQEDGAAGEESADTPVMVGGAFLVCDTSYRFPARDGVVCRVKEDGVFRKFGPGDITRVEGEDPTGASHPQKYQIYDTPGESAFSFVEDRAKMITRVMAVYKGEPLQGDVNPFPRHSIADANSLALKDFKLGDDGAGNRVETACAAVDHSGIHNSRQLRLTISLTSPGLVVVHRGDVCGLGSGGAALSSNENDSRIRFVPAGEKASRYPTFNFAHADAFPLRVLLPAGDTTMILTSPDTTRGTKDDFVVSGMKLKGPGLMVDHPLAP